MLDHGNDGIGLDLLERVGRGILAEIDATPAGHEDQRAVIRHIVSVFLELLLRLFFRLVGDDGDQRVDVYLFGIAPGFGDAAAGFRDVLFENRSGRSSHENALRMFGGKGLAGA
ncbi:hypothetical protein D3C87_948940 [compost metagenome]